MSRQAKIAAGALACLLTAAAQAQTPPVDRQMVVMQPRGDMEARAHAVDPGEDADVPTRHIIDLLRQKVRYVFVLFQENRSFDSYFGSFPGADNLFSRPPGQTPGYTQPLMNTDGTMTTIMPFRIGPAQYAADTDDVDHGQARMAAKMHVSNGHAAMDRFALVEEGKYTPAGANPPLKAKQYAELTMAYEDCDTIPFLWRYASRFTLFDNIFQSTIGPSTPNAIAMIAGQTGETQWVKHPESAANTPENKAHGIGEPVYSDADPAFPPVNPRDHGAVALNQTYATLMLSLAGRTLNSLVTADKNPLADLADVGEDIKTITGSHRDAHPWEWYEEGYDREPNEPASAPADGSHLSYIGHHNGPQYFGYVADNPQMASHLHGLGDFFTDIGDEKLPQEGVYYVRGGYTDIAGLKPALNDPAVQAHFRGDDDHPGYSDAHLSEALVAREVNAIAASKYWDNAAIIITYDESEGDYDHVAPAIIETDPAGIPLRRGPRIPLIVVSPFARAHVVSHESGDHASVIKLIDELFDLTPLADLPDEAAARTAGRAKYGQDYLGPEDDGTPGIGDLTSAFEPARLEGTLAPLPPAYAAIPDTEVAAIPPYGNDGCRAIGIVPDDVAKGIANPIPADFNPRPGTDPTSTTPPALPPSLATPPTPPQIPPAVLQLLKPGAKP